MKKPWSALFCVLIVFSILASAFAETPINAWIERYNKCADTTGAPKIDRTATASVDDDYIFALPQGLSFGVSFGAKGDVHILTTVATSVDCSVESVMAAALAASDDNISEAQALKILAELDLASAISDTNAYIISEKSGWLFCIMNTSTASEFQLTVSAIYGNSVAPDNGNPSSGFWDGLWEDDDETHPEQPTPEKSTPSDKKLHKI